jgi:Flp pilus assembly protein TadD
MKRGKKHLAGGHAEAPKAHVAAGQLGERWQAAGICLALAVITFAVFGQAPRFDFVNFDDDLYVYNNPIVARGLTRRGVVWAFTRVHSVNWHPLTWLSHMLDCQLYGLAPAGHHLTNVLIHAATVIALFLVLRQMTGALWRSGFVAAVFAIHPLRVESVAWVAERKDVLSGLFFMLTVGAYARFARSPWSLARYGLVLLLFAMGLMCKPMLVTLPLVLLLLDYWPLQRTESAGRLLLEKLPLLALSAAGCLITLLAQTTAIHAGGVFSLGRRLGNALVACLIYLGQMVWPTRLAVLYPFPESGWPAWEIAGAGAVLVGVSALAWEQRRTRPWLFTGWVWYLVMLLPVAGIIQVGRQAHADRYTYLPQIGLYIAVTWLAAEWRLRRPMFAALMGAILVLLMACAWKQAAYWKDSETLWRRDIACTTDNEMAHDNLGAALSKKGRVDEAVSEFQTALKIRPASADANYNLGVEMMEKGKLDEAILHFQKAIQTKPDYAEARNHLGVALRQAGRVDEAIVQYQELLKFMPGNESIQVNLANAFLQKGTVDEAILHFQAALQIEPSDVEVQNNLAWLLATSPEAALRDGGKAVPLAVEANNLTDGTNAVILGTLAAAFAESGRFPQAIEAAHRALDLAQAQSNARLAAQLEEELRLYQADRPFHTARKYN